KQLTDQSKMGTQTTTFSTVFDTIPSGKQLKSLTRDEVAKHDKEGDLWCVYDLSKFVDLHPGGASVLLDKTVAGKDATKASSAYTVPRYIIGRIEGAKSEVILPKDGELSLVPHAEPAWLSKGYSSPYYTDSHREFQKAMRLIFDKHITPEAREHELSGKRKLVHHQHELIITQELGRCGARGFSDGLLGGMVIGLPPVLNFGSAELKKKIIPEVLSGKKYIALAISEAFAGSDVAGLRCTATKTSDGQHYIVNGTKKWITNGTFADYFSTGVRTDKGLSVLLIERGEGVETKPIKLVTLLPLVLLISRFDNVKVPAANLLGKENKGLQVILSNFNHERWIMCCGVIRASRFITEECFKWTHQRTCLVRFRFRFYTPSFKIGFRLVPLAQYRVLFLNYHYRQKLAQMFAKCEATQSWLENVTYQMNQMSYAQQADLLAGQIGLLKAFSTRVAHEIADDAVQIFGGRGISATGMGRFVEMFQRSYKFDAVLGGSEEVLFDLGVRQAMRKMPPAVL
ncbi:hypothetical protein PSTT_13004, partial [Puccinia striiformis]